MAYKFGFRLGWYLLTDDHEISTENKEMLAKAQKQGVHVVLASGRPTQQCCVMLENWS
jgi:hypothetical protein